jgi:hypothetical protein
MKPGTEQDWTAVAEHVNHGEWKRPTDSEREALATGLRGFKNKACAKAMAKIDPEKKYRGTEKNEC